MMVVTTAKKLEMMRYYCKNISCRECRLRDDNWNCMLQDAEDDDKKAETLFDRTFLKEN